MKDYKFLTIRDIRLETIIFILVLSFFYIFPSPVFAVSESFPPSSAPPTAEDILSSPNNVYYCSPSGNNSSGDGTIGNPWVDFRGAASTVRAGDVIYLRGGTYPTYAYVNFSRSQNILSVDGSETNPIVITNYPGEIVVYESTDDTWCMTLDGNHQKLIGTKVGGSYGIQITGGISIRANYCRVSGVEFIEGTSNGGDANPGMISVPLNDGCTGTHVSHCYFRDAKYDSDTNRMACLRFFHNTNTLIEYNTFKDNLELRYGGAVYFKDITFNAIIRYNKFINNRYSVQFVGQRTSSNGLKVYNNLFYNDEYPIHFFVELGPNFRIYDNVALNIRGAFFLYHNSGSNTYSDSGEYYNNVIGGTGFAKSWASGASNSNNLPDLFDYNLWYSSADRNASALWSSTPSGYHANSVTINNAVTYNSSTMTCTVSDDYAGKTIGRNSSSIGGFTFGDTTSTPPPEEPPTRPLPPVLRVEED
jgi:hypothetical protein